MGLPFLRTGAVLVIAFCFLFLIFAAVFAVYLQQNYFSESLEEPSLQESSIPSLNNSNSSLEEPEALPIFNSTYVQGDLELLELVGAPTNDSIILNLLAPPRTQVFIEYGFFPGEYSFSSDSFVSSGSPLEITLSLLKADTKYYYRVIYKLENSSDFLSAPEYSFHTARGEGSDFVFCVQGDSHPERSGKMYSSDLYDLTLENVLQESPDFYFTIGDDFSIEKLIEDDALSTESVGQVYLEQREFLTKVGSSAPLFLVNGNHEQAAKYLLDGTPTSAAVLAGNARITYYPLPEPNGFYSGDLEEVEFVGLVKDYYAFEWGDALFVVLDPYWHSDVPVDNVAGEGPDSKKQIDLWDITIGDVQYAWFKKTLEESDSKYKFVFSHHILGTGRGGIENAPYYEWGGYGKKGVWEFEEKRPNWELPIHQLMVENNVSIFFQGHDHLFAFQELDGVVYQSLPNPGDDTYTAFNSDAYLSGDVLPNSGHLKIDVSGQKATVEYVRSYLDGDGENGEVAYSYEVFPASPPQILEVETSEEDAVEEFGSLLLGVPTDKSITLNFISPEDATVYVEYGVALGDYSLTTPPFSVSRDIPAEVVLSGLNPDTQYNYRIVYTLEKSEDLYYGPNHSFHTSRSPGSSFVFAIEADAHIDEQSDLEIYQKTLGNIASSKADFLLDLGDTFMSDKLDVKNSETVEARHILFRDFFNSLEGSVPLFLVLGNHEGEAGWELDGSTENLAVWASSARKLYYPNPTPNEFYSGNSEEIEFVGLPEDYYAFEWGDALFIALDPYYYTEKKPKDNGWMWTLGEDQYLWLQNTLEKSDSKYKFVFIHHLVGGGSQARGGAEFAPYYEWGGQNSDGTWGFSSERAGWSSPIHTLLVENEVDIVFHGHDHFFAYQELDGVVYQLVPQPSHPGEKVTTAEEYGYLSGDIVPGSGYLKVSVSSEEAVVDFIQSGPDEVVYSYSIAPSSPLFSF